MGGWVLSLSVLLLRPLESGKERENEVKRKGGRKEKRERVSLSSFFSRLHAREKKMLGRRSSMPPPAPARPGHHAAATGLGASLVCDEELLPAAAVAEPPSPPPSPAPSRPTSSSGAESARPRRRRRRRRGAGAKPADECGGVKRCFNHLQNQPHRAAASGRGQARRGAVSAEAAQPQRGV